MSGSDPGVTSLCQHGMPIADCNDEQFDADCERSRASSEESDSSGSRVGDSSSQGVNLENPPHIHTPTMSFVCAYHCLWPLVHIISV